jgi:murein hydrolase activator
LVAILAFVKNLPPVSIPKNQAMQKFALVFISFLFLFITGWAQQQQSREELEKRRKEIQQEIEELRKAQSEISRNKKASLKDLSLIKGKIRKRNAVISNINDQVNIIDNTIFTNNREIYRLRKELDTLKHHYARTVVYAYQNRSNYDMLNFIFSSASFNDAIKRITYLKSYRGYREEQVASIIKTNNLLQQRITTLSNNKKEKSQVLAEQNKQRKILEDEQNEQSAFVSKLKAREKELEKELATKRRVERNLQNSIAAIIRMEIKKAEEARKKADAEAKERAAKTEAPANTKTESTAKKRATNILESTPEVRAVSVGFENNRKNLPWPVDQALVTGRFGKRKIEGTTLYEDNIGLYLGTNIGSSVKAVFEGTVSAISDVAGSWAVTIRHGKYLTTYYNLTKVSVSKNQAVKLGQGLGTAAESDDGDGKGEILFVVTVVNGSTSKFLDPELWLKSR